MARVLIAGCGYVGTALAALLAAQGHAVFGLRRSHARVPQGVTLVRADLSQPDTLQRLPEQLDVVVYATSADQRTPQAYRSAYVDGLRNLLACDAVRRSADARLLVVTSTAVYGQDDGSWVDEQSPTRPREFTGRTLLDSEEIAFGAGREVAVVRFGGIYGPGRTRLVDQVRRGEATIPASPLYTNRIHRDDCAGVLAHLAFLPMIEPIYIGVDSAPADKREVVGWLAERLNAPPPRVDASSDNGRAHGKRCRNARLLASGYRFLYPTYREGYEQILSDDRTA